MALTLDVTFDDAGARAAFGRLVALGGSLGPVMDEIGAGFVAAISRRHETQTDPDGRAWAPNRRGGIVLTDSGRLARSWTYRAAPDQVEVGSNVVYAAVHQTGATIRPKTGKALRFQVAGRWATVAEVTIPARPILGIGPAERTVVGDVVRRNVLVALLGRGGSGGAGAGDGGDVA